jgi:ABC-type uncharacterized transport system permease subunit
MKLRKYYAVASIALAQVLSARVIFLGGFGVALLLSGGQPGGGALALVCSALMAVAAATLSLVFSATIGLCAFFMEDTSPVYWVWQKFAFVCGGSTFPLDMYPCPLPGAANATPFPSIFYAPGRIAIGTEPGFAWHTALGLAGCLLVAAITGHSAFRRALKVLEINGA